MRPHVSPRRRPPTSTALPFAGELRKIVPAVRERLDEHVPVRHLDRVENNASVEQRSPRHPELDPPRRQKRAGLSREAFDDEVLDDERPTEQVNSEPTDVHRPADQTGAGSLSTSPQHWPEIDRD